MNRKQAILLVLVAAGLAAGHVQSREKVGEAASQSNVAGLQRQRLKLLEERVALIQSGMARDRPLPADPAAGGEPQTAELVQAHMDLINARLDYASSRAEKKELLADLLKKYDVLIDMAREALQAPVAFRHPETGQFPGGTAGSKLLFLKSERVRVEIQLAACD